MLVFQVSEDYYRDLTSSNVLCLKLSTPELPLSDTFLDISSTYALEFVRYS